MEVKVWVEGLPKTICGVSSATTCQDIVYALAQATGKRGRFILFERWGKNEKPLAPTDQLCSLLQQKGEFRHDVQFILRKTDAIITSNHQSPVSESFSPLPDLPEISPFQRGNDVNGPLGNLRKSVTSQGTKRVQPKVIKTRPSDTSSELILTSSIKENNFPTDLMGVQYAVKENVKESVPGNNLNDGWKPAPAAQISTISKQPTPQIIPPAPVPSADGSMEVQLKNSTVPDMGNKLSQPKILKTDQTEQIKKEARRKQLIAEVQQLDNQLNTANADSAHFDNGELNCSEFPIARI